MAMIAMPLTNGQLGKGHSALGVELGWPTVTLSTYGRIGRLHSHCHRFQTELPTLLGDTFLDNMGLDR